MPTLIAAPEYRQRAEKLTAELRIALKALTRRQLLDWGADAGRMTGHVFVRRGVRFVKVFGAVGRGAISEAGAAFDATRERRFLDHASDRGSALVDTVKNASSQVRKRVTEFSAMVRNPDQLPEAVVMVVAALVSSGGIDANGGVPDLDLQFGIGAHRSILSHSIIAGSAVEGSLYAVATLVGLAYNHLPRNHDSLWDTIERNRVRFLKAAAVGAGAGIAYHLLIDGTLQPGAYHDLPLEMPLAGHEAILTGNAIAEGLDVPAKSKTYQR